MCRRSGQVLLALAALAGPAPAARAAFIYTTLDDRSAAARSTFAFGINGAGAVTGYYNDSGGAFHGFVYSGGSYTTLDDPAAGNTYATAINDSGVVVGS